MYQQTSAPNEIQARHQIIEAKEIDPARSGLPVIYPPRYDVDPIESRGSLAPHGSLPQLVAAVEPQ